MTPAVQRTHDKAVYLQEDRYEHPKEIFKMIFRQVQASGGLRSGEMACDFGCAAGEFLYYLHREAPQARYTGFDIVPELLEKARTRVPGPEFRLGSVLDRGLLPEASIDVALMVGVHEIFDDFRPSFSHLLRWTRPGGRIFIFGGFNPFPVDVWIQYRLVDAHPAAHREAGWNRFAKTSVSRYLDEALGPGRHAFLPFELPFDLAPHPEDPIRTWTVLDAHQRRLLTNGLLVLVRLELLEIRR